MGFMIFMLDLQITTIVFYYLLIPEEFFSFRADRIFQCHSIDSSDVESALCVC
jgi:hypothetical protein